MILRLSTSGPINLAPSVLITDPATYSYASAASHMNANDIFSLNCSSSNSGGDHGRRPSPWDVESPGPSQTNTTAFPDVCTCRWVVDVMLSPPTTLNSTTAEWPLIVAGSLCVVFRCPAHTQTVNMTWVCHRHFSFSVVEAFSPP